MKLQVFSSRLDETKKVNFNFSRTSSKSVLPSPLVQKTLTFRMLVRNINIQFFGSNINYYLSLETEKFNKCSFLLICFDNHFFRLTI